MRILAALVRRELGVYFFSPMAYIILVAVLFIAGLFFVSSMSMLAQNRLPVDYQSTLSSIMLVIVATSPLVTMRLVAEEKSRGTLELALTAPVTELQFVLAKFLASLVLLAFLLAPTVGYVLIISRYGQVDAGAIFCGYAGILLLGGVVYSIGLLVSSLCTSQVTAGVVTFSISIVLLMCFFLGQFMPEGSPWRVVLELVDLNSNFGDFLKGVVDRARLTYLLSVILLCLYLTVRGVESRRWR